MQTPSVFVGVAALAATLAVLGGCVTTETVQNLHAPQQFTGFASAPGATVELYAFDHSANAWESQPMATVTASSSPLNYGGRTIYPWTTSATIIDGPSDWCRVSPSCSPGHGTVRLQFREPGGQLGNLLTFDPGGVSCTMDAVSAGQDLFVAAWNCKGTIWDEVRVPIVV